MKTILTLLTTLLISTACTTSVKIPTHPVSLEGEWEPINQNYINKKDF